MTETNDVSRWAERINAHVELRAENCSCLDQTKMKNILYINNKSLNCRIRSFNIIFFQLLDCFTSSKKKKNQIKINVRVVNNYVDLSLTSIKESVL